MAFSHKNSKGVTYFLHAKKRVLKSGKSQSLYYFSKKVGEGAVEAVPTGYMVSETQNGLPVLKKK